MERALRRSRWNEGGPGVDGTAVTEPPGSLRKHSPGTRRAARRTGRSLVRNPTPEPTETDHTTVGGFPIVGIGASAGGLGGFEAFFSGMPADSDPGMAFVLVQHLAPDHKSILTDLIRRYTRMQVFEVEDGMEVRPNCAYIIPPGRDMAFLNGALQLLVPAAPHGQRLPIDFFFRSLAQDQRERAIGVVLSGTGSDGTLGVRAIKSEGGMVMVQSPESAEYDSMPRNAIDTGLVDYKLPPAEMPAQLIAYSTHAFGTSPRTAALPAPRPENSLKRIFVLLRAHTGHDFSRYKPSTSQRRIERRMAVHQIESMDAYAKFMQQTPAEMEGLFREMLIGVTNFFRDPEAFEALEANVIPRLFADKPANSPIRVWVPGCSTGEEAYSLAIVLAERLENLKKSYTVQVFATDIDSHAIAAARTGIYPASIAEDLTPARLARFFSPQPGESALRVHKRIRDTLVFSEQSVVKDPPFSKLDLISCRNLLIYLGGELQKEIIPLFHYALKPGGFLFLGTSETVGECHDLFVVLDRKWKLYRRNEDLLGARRAAPVRFLPSTTTPADPAASSPGGKTAHPRRLPLRELTEQALLKQIAQAGALVNAQGDILYIHGRSGKYLEPAPGESGASNILKMAREGLRRDLTTSLHKAAGAREIVRCPGLRVRANGEAITVDLTVRPVAAAPATAPEPYLYLVVLEQVQKSVTRDRPSSSEGRDAKPASGEETEDPDTRIATLTRELRAKEEYLQATNEELETSNEELRSTNEELQSTNEELQSANEELETSKEELQSVNEELSTVNAELQAKVADLTRANNDMHNVLAGTGIATIFVDHQLRIVRFTPATTEIINLIQGDIGRPVSHIVSNLRGYSTLAEDARVVLDTLVPKKADVQTVEGRWYTMHIQPYRTTENVIEGAVLTFVDVTASKETHEALRVNEERLRVALSSASISVFNQDVELRYTWIDNPHPGFEAEHVIGKTDAELLPEDEAATLTAIKQKVLESGRGLQQRVRTTAAGRVLVQDLTIEPLRDSRGDIVGITGASVDVTGEQGREETDAGEDRLKPARSDRETP